MTGHGVSRLPKVSAGIGKTINYSGEEKVQETNKKTSVVLEQLSSHLPQVPNRIEKKIVQLLKCYPEGLEIEKFNLAYLKRYRKPLIASEFGFLDIVDLLCNLKGNVLKVVEVNGQQLLLKADKASSPEIAEDQRHPPRGYEENMASQVPDEIVSVIKAIVKDNKGGINLENLNNEFMMKTNKKLDLQTLGFSCIYDLVSSLGENFKIFNSGNQFILCDAAIKTISYSDTTSSVMDSHSTVRIFSNETKERLSKLLQEEFPCGLTIDELRGAYRMKDLTLSAVNAVSFGAVYKNLEQHALLHVGEYVEVVIAEIYSPDKFWVILRQPETSGALDCLMNNLFEFYSSKVGDRYMVSPHLITIGAPVVVYYEDDKNYYRALITSIEDVRTVKLFLVDYGTVFTCDYSDLRQLHEKFFTLPAQAIKAALDEIVPPDGKKLWPKLASKRFLNMVKNKGLVAKVTMLKEKVYMELWDTSEKADINIADVLIVEGLAESNRPIDCVNMLSKRSSSDQSEPHTSSYQKPRKENITQETVPVRFPKCEVATPEESNNSLNPFPSGSVVDESGIRNLMCDNNAPFGTLVPVNKSGINCNQKESHCPKLERVDLASYCNFSSFTQSDLIFSDPLLRKEIFDKGQEIQQLHLPCSFPYHSVKQYEPVATQVLPSSLIKSDKQHDEMHMYQQDMDFPSPINSHELRGRLPDRTSLIPCKNEELIRVTPKSSSGPAPVNVLSPQSTSVKYISPPPGFEHLGFVPTSLCSSQVPTSVQESGYIGSHVKEEETEHRTFHSVELVKTSDSYSFHILMLYGTPYVLAADISRILKSNENLDTALDQKGWKFPSISIGKFTDKDLYHQLFKLGSGVIYDEAICEVRPCLSAFPLRDVPEILELLGFHDKDTIYALRELIQKYSQEVIRTTTKESNIIENLSSTDNLSFDISRNLKVAGFDGRENCSERDCSNSRNLNFEVPQNIKPTYNGNGCKSANSESYVNEHAKPALDVSCVDYRLSEIVTNPLQFITAATYVNQNKLQPEIPMNSLSHEKQSTPLVRFSEIRQPTEFSNTYGRISEGSIFEKKLSSLPLDNNRPSTDICPAISQGVFFTKNVDTVSPSSMGVLDVENNVNDKFQPVYEDKFFIESNQAPCITGLPIAKPLSYCSVGGNATSKHFDTRGVGNTVLTNPALQQEPNTDFYDAFNNIHDPKVDTAVDDQFQFCPQKSEISPIVSANEILGFGGTGKLESFSSVAQGLNVPRTRWLKNTVNQGGLRKPNKINSDLPVYKSVTPGSQEKSNPIHSVATQQSITVSEKEYDNCSCAFTPQSSSFSDGASHFIPLSENEDVSGMLDVIPSDLGSGSLGPRKNGSCISSYVTVLPGTPMTTPVNEHILRHSLSGKKSPDELYLLKETSITNENQSAGTTCISTSSSFKELEREFHSINGSGKLSGKDYEPSDRSLNKRNVNYPQNDVSQTNSNHGSLLFHVPDIQKIYEDNYKDISESVEKNKSLFDGQLGSANSCLVSDNLQWRFLDKKAVDTNRKDSNKELEWKMILQKKDIILEMLKNKLKTARHLDSTDIAIVKYLEAYGGCKARNMGKDLGTADVKDSLSLHAKFPGTFLEEVELRKTHVNKSDMNGSKMGPCFEGGINPNKNPCPQTEGNSRVPCHNACKDSLKEDTGERTNNRCKSEVSKEEVAIGKGGNEEKIYSFVEQKLEEGKCTEEEILHHSPVNRISLRNSSPDSSQITPSCVDEKEKKGNEYPGDLCSSLDIQEYEQLLQELKLLNLGLQLKKQEYKTIVSNYTDSTLLSMHHHLEKLTDVIFELRKRYKEKKMQIENIIVQKREQRSNLLAGKHSCHARNFENPSLPVRNNADVKMPSNSSSSNDHNAKDVSGRYPTNTELALDQVEEFLRFPSGQSIDPVCSKNPSSAKREGDHNVNTKFLGDQSLQNNQNTLVNSKETMVRFNDVLHQPEIKGNMCLSDLPGINFKTQNNFSVVPHPVDHILGIQNRHPFPIHAGNQNRDIFRTGCPLMSQAYPYRANPPHYYMGQNCYNIPVRPSLLAFNQPVRHASITFNQVSQHSSLAPSPYLYDMYPSSPYLLPM
ncbi:uncharacterized protein [Palaemon carinicauda]|uniref:uncharacterized protein isoform X2 n=1 Tax=Palaemon carinicauda TaxID=392227 RepID=UPI0035B5C93C